MDRRTTRTTLCLTLALLTAMASGQSAAQDKSESKTKAPVPKSADHATTGDETATVQMTSGAADQAAIWPGMTRGGTVVLPNGWSLKPAGRQTRLGDLPVQIAVHPERADPGHPPRRLRRARDRDGRWIQRPGDRPRVPSRQLRRPGLVGRRQAALRRRRIRRPDLPLRPCRRACSPTRRSSTIPTARRSWRSRTREKESGPRSTSACRRAWR